MTIAADPKHLGARIGITAVLHTWGSAMSGAVTLTLSEIAFRGAFLASADTSRTAPKRPRTAPLRGRLQAAANNLHAHQFGPVRGAEMTAKIDLSDLFDLFGKVEEILPVAPPVSPEARKWRGIFGDNLAVVLRARNIPRTEAEKVAFANTVTAFLNASHPNTPSDRCHYCGKLETPGAPLQPIGWGARHTWLHADPCWASWRDRRRADAIASVAEMGVTAPTEDLQPEEKNRE